MGFSSFFLPLAFGLFRFRCHYIIDEFVSFFFPLLFYNLFTRGILSECVSYVKSEYWVAMQAIKAFMAKICAGRRFCACAKSIPCLFRIPIVTMSNAVWMAIWISTAHRKKYGSLNIIIKKKKKPKKTDRKAKKKSDIQGGGDQEKMKVKSETKRKAKAKKKKKRVK